MTNLDSVLKSRNPLPTKVRVVKAMGFSIKVLIKSEALFGIKGNEELKNEELMLLSCGLGEVY